MDNCRGCGAPASFFPVKGTAHGVCRDCYAGLSPEERRAYIERKLANFGRRA